MTTARESGIPDEDRVRTLLRHTWHAFYGRFGRLRRIQRIAAEPICRGRDILVGAPTASGKTEAVIAPMLERVLVERERSRSAEHGGGLELLIVTPTRALTRDLERRLRRPADECGLQVGVKTGDASPSNYDDLPDILVTTPESLDSILSRHPRSLRFVSGMVLDELHLLDGTTRGDQLQALIRRCRQVQSDHDMQICGASATLANGDALAERYLSTDAQFLEADNKRGGSSEQRRLDAQLVRASALEHASAVIADIFRRGEARKLLVFANARAQVEELSAKLRHEPLLHDRVVSHHGSLSRAERLRAEEKLRDAPAAICIATMTLEVGIDVGDVDRAVLVGVPPNVSSLLQRIGRSNRRDDVTEVTCLYDGEFEKLRMTHLLECATKGELFEEDLPFRPTVIPQQALSLLFQNPAGWIDAGALYERLPDRAQQVWDRTDCREILRRMADDNVLHPMRKDRFAATETAEKMHNYGQTHSNIEGDREVQVIDEMTRQVVGTVRFFDSHRQSLMNGENLAVSLGGEGREVVRMEDDQLVSRSRDDLDDGDAQFVATQPPRYSRSLARDFARFLDVPPRTMILEEIGDSILLFHFLGTVWGRVYEQMLRNRNLVTKRGTHGAFFFRVNRRPDEESETGEEARGRFFRSDELRGHAEAALARHRAKFMRLLGAGPNQGWLPKDMKERWLRRAVDVERFVDVISHTEIVQGEILDAVESE